MLETGEPPKSDGCIAYKNHADEVIKGGNNDSHHGDFYDRTFNSNIIAFGVHSPL